MKKVLSILLVVFALTLMLVLFACIGNNGTTSNNPPAHEHTIVIDDAVPIRVAAGCHSRVANVGDRRINALYPLDQAAALKEHTEGRLILKILKILKNERVERYYDNFFSSHLYFSVPRLG